MNQDYSVPGFDAAGIVANIKKNGAPDLALIAGRTPCRAAATFTKNQFPAAPVLYDRQLLDFNPSEIHGVIINSGNANACTGAEGLANARRTAEAVEAALGSSDQSVFVMSTGVIGVQLPIDKLLVGAPKAVDALQPDGWEAASRAIMTTDTRPKVARTVVEIAGRPVTIAGMCKGAGMIHPNMATMLAIVTTDAAVEPGLLAELLREATGRSLTWSSV